MLKALFTAATGMRAQQTRIDVIANNLANVNTTGFKKSLANFKDLVYTTRQEASKGQSLSRPTALQVGSGASLVSTTKVFTPGVIEETGQPLDMVIEGQGFFELEDIDGSPVYSRDGNFKLDAEGSIVNSDGYRLANIGTVEPGASISVSPEGEINARVGSAAPTLVGQIQLSNFPNPAGLDALGNNLLKATEASGSAFTGSPGSGQGLGRIQSGYLERSNVEVVSELVNLIVSQRAYETNSRAISAADDMLTTVNQIIN